VRFPVAFEESTDEAEVEAADVDSDADDDEELHPANMEADVTKARRIHIMLLDFFMNLHLSQIFF
jgi:hypothetical protein